MLQKNFTTALLISSLTLLTGVSKANAKVYLEGSLGPIYNESNKEPYQPGGGSRAEAVPTESTVGYDIRATLGYVAWDSMLLGLTYNMMSSTMKRPVAGTTDGAEDSTTVGEYGPTIGYIRGGWRLAFTYLMSSEAKYSVKRTDYTSGTSSSYEVTNKDGSGFQLAAGYAFNLNNYFQIGPSLIYRSVSYSKQSSTHSSFGYQDATLTTKATETTWVPMITMALVF